MEHNELVMLIAERVETLSNVSLETLRVDYLLTQRTRATGRMSAYRYSRAFNRGQLLRERLLREFLEVPARRFGE